MLRRLTLLCATCVLALLATSAPAASSPQQELFRDDFEGDLSGWEISNTNAIRIVDSGDEHGRVLEMAAEDARLAALFRGSENWSGYRVEADFLFPTDEHNYLGFIYNLVEVDGRVDLGSLYVKGNGSYIQSNPRTDWNPMRTVFPEQRVDLTGNDAIVIGGWHRMAAEVVGNVCHLYVDDMEVPKITFDFYPYASGKAGFKPRVVGGPVRIDDVRVESIEGFSWQGGTLPAIEYHRDALVTDWKVLRRLTRVFPEIEKLSDPTTRGVVDEGVAREWEALPADRRGGVVTGYHADFLGPRTVAYFATTIEVEGADGAVLEFSAADDLTIWSNGRFYGYDDRGAYAWFDFGTNPDHPRTTSVGLEPGTNHVLVRVRGGIYATGGFFARVVPR